MEVWRAPPFDRVYGGNGHVTISRESRSQLPPPRRVVRSEIQHKRVAPAAIGSVSLSGEQSTSELL